MITAAAHGETNQWRPSKPFSQLPPYSQQKAYKVKEALSVYFAFVKAGMAKSDAITRSRSLWLALLGRSISEKQIRRRVARVKAWGGPDSAPIEAYADQKSVSHRCKTRREEEVIKV